MASTGRSIVFEGLIQGLVIAEVQGADPQQRIELPPWVGEEITFNPRYSNSNLARSPIRDRAVHRRSTYQCRICCEPMVWAKKLEASIGSIHSMVSAAATEASHG